MGKHLEGSKHFFTIPTDAHNYKITGMLKTIKIPIIAPTYFGSHRNHHQGAISCLAKTTIMILLCWSLMTWSMSWWHTNLCASVTAHISMLLKSRMSPDMLPFTLCNKKRLAIQHVNRPLFRTTLVNSVLQHQEVGRAEDLPALPHTLYKCLCDFAVLSLCFLLFSANNYNSRQT